MPDDECRFGSNLFNTLAVVGIAGMISPLKVPTDVLTRDYPFMAALTVLLFLLIFAKRGKGRLARIEGAILLLLFFGYTAFLLVTSLAR
jgi:cation:H+ antiporter